jgi:hypothetical protein
MQRPVSQFADPHGRELYELHCELEHVVEIDLVSGTRLPKTGIFGVFAGDFAEMACEFAILGVQRQASNCKSPPTEGFSPLGTLNAYYFASDGSHCIPHEFWATENADGVIESGNYWPYGRPIGWHETRPNCPSFLRESELKVLLEPQPTKKLPFPTAKMPALIEALRKLDDLPNRKKQREALHKLPEFERYHLTADVLREAEKKVPRSPGRKWLHTEE